MDTHKKQLLKAVSTVLEEYQCVSAEKAFAGFPRLVQYCCYQQTGFAKHFGHKQLPANVNKGRKKILANVNAESPFFSDLLNVKFLWLGLYQLLVLISPEKLTLQKAKAEIIFLLYSLVHPYTVVQI